MLYTITNSSPQNGRPTQVGSTTINISYGGTHVFTIANFTTETTPVYSDPEGDALSLVKVTSLPTSGTLQVNGIDVVLGQSITAGDISTGNFTYIGSADGDFSFGFDVADEGSNSFSGLDTGQATMSVSPAINLPPSTIGNNTFNLAYSVSKVFTVADFTSGTTPAYVDPEGDAASKVKILTLPANGNLVFNGTNVIANQEMTVAEIASGYLVYVPDLVETGLQNLSFNFSVADAGSGQYST